MYAHKIRIENWKNFKLAEFDLERRLFLIGPNAAGKSNLLDVFRFLRDLSVSGGGLEQAVDSLRGGVSAIRCLAARKHSEIIIDVELREEKNTEEYWRYKLAFSQDNNRNPVVRQEFVEHNGKEIINRPDADDKSDQMRLTETAVEQISANKDFRPVVEFFQAVKYQHLLPQVIRDPQGFSPSKVENDPFGRDFLQRVENTSEKIKNSRLRKILKVLKVAAPQLSDLRVERDNFGVPHLIGVYEHWRPGAGKQNESQFSDGTLRLFGLLWTLFEGDGLLLLEEPELSLHEEVVRQLPRLIESVNRERKVRRQVVISTHSHAMLNDAGISATEVIRLEPHPEGTRAIRSVDDPEAVEMLKNGLTAAEVLLPKSAPKNIEQFSLAF